MGAGKTALALTAIRELIDDEAIRQALVLAPKKVAQLVWPAEPSKWEHLAGMGVAVGVGSPAVRKAALNAAAEVIVQTHDNVKWLVGELLKLPENHPLFDLLVIDEGSRFRNPKSKRAKDLMKVRKRFRNVWIMTGTPRPNGYEDQFTPMKILTNGALWGKSFYAWRDQNFFPTDWNGYNWSILPAARRTIRADIARMSFTVGPDEMPELPEMIDDERTITRVDLPPDARREYDRMLKYLIAKWGGTTKLAANAAVASGQLEQIAQGFLYSDVDTALGEDMGDAPHMLHDEKLDALDEIVEGLAGDPAIVCYWYKADLWKLEGRFGKLPAINSTTKDIVRTVAEFKTGKVPLLLLQPASGGHGLDGLQDSCSQMVWYTPIWSKELYDQTRKRVHRPGQARRTFIRTIMARGTVDEAKRSRVTEGLGEADAFLRYLAEMERLK
jgi:hypothetical protein